MNTDLKKELRVIVADIITEKIDQDEMDQRLIELENLVKTYHGLVIIKTIQKRSHPDYSTYIGKGKLEEIRQEMLSQKADLLIIGNILKPYQIYNINEFISPGKIKAWDRIDLILKIFERHAKSSEARLQIELASIKHMGPRIFGMGMQLSRQGGGIGTKGIGETNTERMRRHLKEKEAKILKKLEGYKKTRQLHRLSRLKNNLQTVGIVGYTNAGKSSLLNALTSKGVLSEDKLFATLGTNVGKMYVATDDIGGGKEVLLSDTIGFIRDLPPNLINAFSSTLEDSIESKLLLHVIDSTDNNILEKINIVDDILSKIGANQNKIYIFNKIDLLNNIQIEALKKEFKKYNPIFISADNKVGLEKLKKTIIEFI